MPGLDPPRPKTPPLPEDIEGLPRYPQIAIELEGESGNAFSILGRVERAFSLAGVSASERAAFRTEATSGDFDHLLQTVMAWVATDIDATDR